MQQNFVINSEETAFAVESDNEMVGLTFHGNKKISFLPSKVADSFPNLLGYNVGSCSIRTISKDSFVHLSKLKELYLDSNKIETVSSDSFEGLTSLQLIALGRIKLLAEWAFLKTFFFIDKNQIKAINSRTFQGLYNLNKVYLRNNECVKEDFIGEDRTVLMFQILDRQCGFDEAKIYFEVLTKNQNEQFAMLEIIKKDMMTDLAKKTAEVIEHLTQIASLKAKLKDAENQIQIQDALSKELYKTIDSKQREIDQLLDEKQRSYAEINEKNQEISSMKKKIEVLRTKCE